MASAAVLRQNMALWKALLQLEFLLILNLYFFDHFCTMMLGFYVFTREDLAIALIGKDKAKLNKL